MAQVPKEVVDPPVAASFQVLGRLLGDLVACVAVLGAGVGLRLLVLQVVGVETGCVMEVVDRVLSPWLWGLW